MFSSAVCLRDKNNKVNFSHPIYLALMLHMRKQNCDDNVFISCEYWIWVFRGIRSRAMECINGRYVYVFALVQLKEILDIVYSLFLLLATSEIFFCTSLLFNHLRASQKKRMPLHRDSDHLAYYDACTKHIGAKVWDSSRITASIYHLLAIGELRSVWPKCRWLILNCAEVFTTFPILHIQPISARMALPMVYIADLETSIGFGRGYRQERICWQPT